MQKILEEIKTDNEFIIELMYCGTKNMLRHDIYGAVGLGNRCFVRPELRECLERVRKELKKRSLKLKICDGYRPPQAHEKMLEIIPMAGFFARSPELSQHCQGSAIDVVLCDKNHKELNFPCKVDAYDEKYALAIAQGKWDEFHQHLERGKYEWTSSQEQEAIANRNLQREIMENAGLKALPHEWWHFNLPNKELYKTIDFRIDNGKFLFQER